MPYHGYGRRRPISAAEWFFAEGTKQAGPFTRDQIQSLIVSSKINDETLLWRPGYAQWMPLSEFREFDDVPPRYESKISAGRDAELRGSQNGHDLEIGRKGHSFDGAPLAANPNQWVDESPHPWRRYFARTLDTLLWGTLLGFLLGVGLAFYGVDTVFFALFEGPAGRFVDTIFTIILCTIPNAILIGLTGGNFGKWLFGICVLDQEDRPIGLLRGFQREIRVLVYGLGLGIPIVTLITSIMAYQKLKADSITSWDKALNLKIVHRKNGAVQYVGAAIGTASLIGLFVLLAMA